MILLLAVSSGSASADRYWQRAGRSRAPIPNPHRHRLGEDVLSDVAPEIKIIEADAPSDREKENFVENKEKTFRAFTTTTTGGLERLFFEDMRTKKTYEIQGVAWPNRPLNDPVCVGNYLIFDRSVNPRRSIHYAFELKKRLIVAAHVFEPR
jgi:hypothetical protein